MSQAEFQKLATYCRANQIMHAKLGDAEFTFHPQAFEKPETFAPSEEPAEPVVKPPTVDDTMRALLTAEGRA